MEIGDENTERRNEKKTKAEEIKKEAEKRKRNKESSTRNRKYTDLEQDVVPPKKVQLDRKRQGSLTYSGKRKRSQILKKVSSDCCLCPGCGIDNYNDHSTSV